MNESVTPPPGFEQFANLPRRFNLGVARASELHDQGRLERGRDLEFIERLMIARAELDNPRHSRSAKTIRRALAHFDREIAIFEVELDRMEARLLAMSSSC